jgi:hypothetical protein
MRGFTFTCFGHSGGYPTACLFFSTGAFSAIITTPSGSSSISITS